MTDDLIIDDDLIIYERDARDLKCPFSQSATYGNRNCIGGGCMAWVKTHNDINRKDLATMGYCRLIMKA